MTSAFEQLQKLSSRALEELANELDAHGEDRSLSRNALQQIVGSSTAVDFVDSLDGLRSSGWTNRQIAVVAAEIREARQRVGDVENLFDIVLTGPEVSGVPTRDTAAVLNTLIAEAEEEVVLVGYAVYNGRTLFRQLATRMAEQPSIRVDFLLNIPRQFKDTSLDVEIVRRFSADFSSKHWPWEVKPNLYYDPRSLEADASKRASLHAKCVIIDRATAMITSANFTEAAQERNIEAGVLVSYAPFVQRIAEYFLALKETKLRRCDL